MPILQTEMPSINPILELELADVMPSSSELRPLNQELVDELQRSISNVGLLQPIVVRRRASKYETVFGNHRLEACRRLGLERIRAIKFDLSDDESFLARVSENLLRNNFIDPLVEAEGYKRLVANGWTIHAIGNRVGKCDSYICERMAILDRLSPITKDYVSRGTLSASHGELLSRVRDMKRQEEIAELVRIKRLSVRSLEELLGRMPPAVVQTKIIAGVLYVPIPREFADLIHARVGEPLFLYSRNRKLILESAKLEDRHGTHACKSSHVRSEVLSKAPESSEKASTKVLPQ